MDKKEISKLAEEVLKENPEVNEVYSTSDGSVFKVKNDANNHAKNLGEEPETHNRDKNPALTYKPLDKMNKAELTAICHELELEIPDGATNKDMVKLIEDKRAEQPE
jgi:hypothetical protein